MADIRTPDCTCVHPGTAYDHGTFNLSCPYHGEYAIPNAAEITEVLNAVATLVRIRDQLPTARRSILNALGELRKADSDDIDLDHYLRMAYGTGYFTLQRIAPGSTI